MQRDAAEYAVKERTARETEQGKKQAAAAELGMMDTKQQQKIRQDEMAQRRQFEADQAALDREARKAEQERAQAVEQRMAADNATLRRDLEARSNATQLQIAGMKKNTEDKIDKVAERAIDRENRKSSAKVKQGIVGSMGQYATMLDAASKGDPNGQTPDQIYEVVLNEIDANVDDPKIANDLRHFTLEKLGPLFQRFYDAQDAAKQAPQGGGFVQGLTDWWNKPYNDRIAREAAAKQAAK
jgi:hypothetical protein